MLSKIFPVEHDLTEERSALCDMPIGRDRVDDPLAPINTAHIYLVV